MGCLLIILGMLAIIVLLALTIVSGVLFIAGPIGMIIFADLIVVLALIIFGIYKIIKRRK